MASAKNGSIGPPSPVSTSTAGLAARASAGTTCSALSRCATVGPAGMREHEAADVGVGQHRVEDLADEAGLAHADGRVVERVLGHRVAGQLARSAPSRSASVSAGSSRPMSSAKSSAMFFIAPEPVTKAGPPGDGAGKRSRIAVVSNSSSSESTCTTASRLSSADAVAWSPASAPVCDCAASRARALLPGISSTIGLPASRAWRCERQEQLRPAHLLDIHRDHARLCIGDVVREDVLDADRRLVAGRGHRGQRQAAADEGVAQVGRHRAALRDARRYPAGPAPGYGATGSKVNGTPASKLVKPMQLGPSSSMPAGVRRFGDFVLLARGPRRRSRRSRTRRAPPRRRARAAQAAHRVEHAGLGNREHGDVDAFGQLVDRLHAGAAVDLGAAAADEVDARRRSRSAPGWRARSRRMSAGRPRRRRWRSSGARAGGRPDEALRADMSWDGVQWIAWCVVVVAYNSTHLDTPQA